MAPLFGYNTNLRHGKTLYHIQTEDSGKERGAIVTHIFVEGGRILDTRKTSYLEKAKGPGWEDLVKKMMQVQHKQMCIAIRDGHYDSKAESPDGKKRKSKAASKGAQTRAQTSPQEPSDRKPSRQQSIRVEPSPPRQGTLLKTIIAEAERDLLQ